MTIKTRLLVLTPADNGNREDCSVFYSRYLLVSTSTLNFDEPIFSSEDEVDDDKKVIADIRALGYTVEDIESTIICSNDSEDDLDDETLDDIPPPFNPWSPSK